MLDRSQMGANAFAAHLWLDETRQNPDFVLNRPPYDQAAILVARENFGCGSSREMAVWSLLGIGVRCVIAPSFGDIFYTNCTKNGLLPVRLPADQVETLLALAAADPSQPFEVDLVSMTVTGPDGTIHPFQISDYHRRALLSGLDEIAMTLTRMDLIRSHEARYLQPRPWLADCPEMAGGPSDG